MQCSVQLLLWHGVQFSAVCSVPYGMVCSAVCSGAVQHYAKFVSCCVAPWHIIHIQAFKHLVDSDMMAQVNELIKDAISKGGVTAAASSSSSSSTSKGAGGEKHAVLSFF